MASVLADGAIMGIPPSEMKALTWWEYQGLLWQWGERHRVEGEEEPPPAPDPAFVMKRGLLMERMGIRDLH